MATRGTRKKTADKPHYHHGDLRQALLDASLALITEEGFGALSLREVARRAGVTHAAPYRHFADKEALLAAVAEQGFRTMAARMKERMDRETALEARLLACGVAYVLFAVEHPAHFRVMFGPHLTRPLDSSTTEGEDSAFGLLMGSLQALHRAGLTGGGEPPVLALSCWSLVHGLAALLVDRQLDVSLLSSPEQVAALAQTQTRLLMRGLLRRAGD
jgi:AcrR family transcriptional regulator